MNEGGTDSQISESGRHPVYGEYRPLFDGQKTGVVEEEGCFGEIRNRIDQRTSLSFFARHPDSFNRYGNSQSD